MRWARALGALAQTGSGALDSGAKGAKHLKGNFVDLEAFHGTSLVAAASRPPCTDDGSLAGRKEETTRSARNLRGRRQRRDTADARARRQTQIATACPLPQNRRPGRESQQREITRLRAATEPGKSIPRRYSNDSLCS